MKIINSIILFMFCGLCMAQTQNVEWDSTYRPRSYKLRVAQFNMFPNSNDDIIFLGNSITAGVEWKELLGNSKVQNRGISGDITFGVLERIEEIAEGNPAKVFLLIGINDVARNIPDSITSTNHLKIVRYLKTHAPNTKIYLQTLLPVNKDFDRHKAHYNKDEKILRINEKLKQIAKEENVYLIDLYSNFLDEEGKLEEKYTYDGLHLTAEGYKHWAYVLSGYID
ncbi:GDSL-type esterase/lipase family protein [Flavivirga sp. 57AJ16]|uniref:GDSL-type esterase/lipase family protein n=1 Tax=Flavivirga sp. 57AJ16 TaxID=3025307 RepID=UPI0023673BB7|nr:GDSL-type esterase/lipase family protein [Flavivirga sp. 57AJ16]MDD7886273.1 GDSL-type esterase/lipase family protein [Flavivirga sp. 57AJ16]